MGRLFGELCVAGLMAGAILAACFLAPTESTMGHAQRIVYIHVPVAWLGLLAFLGMAGSGLAYLAGRNLGWDHWFQAAGELGWLCCGLTLVTGSLWAHEAWGTWWEWDPRLTTAFILWAIYSGVLLVRAGIEDPHRGPHRDALIEPPRHRRRVRVRGHGTPRHDDAAPGPHGGHEALQEPEAQPGISASDQNLINTGRLR